MQKFFCVLLLIGFSNLRVFATDWQKLSIGANFYGGYMQAHKATVANLEAHTWALDISVGLRSTGKAAWQRLYRYPNYGIIFLYTDLGLPKLTGRAYALIPFIDFPLTKNPNSRLTFRTGMGLAYFDTPFDIKTNPKNRAIGTYAGAGIQLYFIYYQRIYKNLMSHWGIGLTHFSNAKFEQPNQGLNMPNVTAGLAWDFSSNLPLNKDPLPDFTPRNHLQTYLSFATKDEGGILSDRYNALTVGITGLRHLCRKSKVGAGIDIFYDPALPRFIYPDSIRSQNGFKSKAIENFQFGVKVGHDLVVGKFNIITHLGYYFYTPTNFNGRFYQRIGFKIDDVVLKKVYIGVFLKTHFARADFCEWAVGYEF